MNTTLSNITDVQNNRKRKHANVSSIDNIMLEEEELMNKRAQPTKVAYCKLAKEVKSPFVIHSTTRELSNFFTRISNMVKEFSFVVKFTEEEGNFLHICVTHESQTCALSAKFRGTEIQNLLSEEEQPLIKVDSKMLLNNCSLKIANSPAQLLFDRINNKLVIVAVCQRANLKLFTPTLLANEPLPDIDCAREKAQFLISVPLDLFRAGIKLANQKDEKEISLMLCKNKHSMFYFGMLSNDGSNIMVGLNTASTNDDDDTCVITFDEACEQAQDYDSVDMKQMNILFNPAAFSVSYINKFLSCLQSGPKTIEIGLNKDSPLSLTYGDIFFVLSQKADTDSSDSESESEEESDE